MFIMIEELKKFEEEGFTDVRMMNCDTGMTFDASLGVDDDEDNADAESTIYLMW